MKNMLYKICNRFLLLLSMLLISSAAFSQADIPENISSAECFVKYPSSKLEIMLKDSSNVLVHILAQPLVGDIDEDGKSEVIVTNSINSTEGIAKTGYNLSDSIIILDHNLNLKYKFRIPPTNVRTIFPIALVRPTKASKPLIIVATGTTMDGLNEHYLYAYEIDGAEVKIKWETKSTNQKYYSSATPPDASISLVVGDINNDGVAEVLVADRIFNAETGALLATLSPGGRAFRTINGNAVSANWDKVNLTYMPVLANVDDDDNLEVLAGNTVYKVNITNVHGELGNSVSKLSSINLLDGFTSVADIDLDGKLDVVVTASDGVDLHFYVWNPRTPVGKLIGAEQKLVGAIGGSRAFIGDMDNDGIPDIAFTYVNQIVAYHYKGNVMSRKWIKPTSDASGATTLSMFDFNQDNEVELVYRDMTQLRIINKLGVNIDSFDCKSATHTEYPIIVDFDNDGHADILVSGYMDKADKVKIFRYSGKNSNWAPARRIWNQHGYNSINVNDDLSVPKVEFNPSTIFNGRDGNPNSGDEVRPFNGYLMQQTMLNKDGYPLYLGPGNEITDISYDYDPVTDSMIVTSTVKNIGDASFVNPFYITAYKNNIGNATKVTYKHKHDIKEGDSAVIRFGIPKLTETWSPFSTIVVHFNDKGDGELAQDVCVESGVREYRSGNPIASNDHISVIKNSENNRIEVSANDVRPTTCINPEITIVTPPKNGAMPTIVEDTVVMYTPNTDFVGLDSITYKISCSVTGTNSLGKVIINVFAYPDNMSEEHCFIKQESKEWSIAPADSIGDKISVYQSPIIGDLDGDGFVEIIISKNPTSTLHTNGYYTDNGIQLYDTKDKSTRVISTVRHALSRFGPLGMAMAIGSGATTHTPLGSKLGLIVVSGSKEGTDKEAYLYAYNKAGTQIWKSDKPYIKDREWDYFAGTVSFTDFNGDGYPEIYVRDKIFDLETGKLLLDLKLANIIVNQYELIGVADILGLGNPQMAIANEIYKIDIKNRTGEANNKATLVKSVEEPSYVPSNPGESKTTLLADFNKDGKLEVLVKGQTWLYIWDPRTERVTGGMQFTNAIHQGRGPVFIGDIDRDGYPEILYSGVGRVTAIDVDGRQPKIKWNIETNDVNSGYTGITLFDFNQDGYAELIYRDQEDLRIINGSLKSHLTGKDTIVYDLYKVPCFSGTQGEYPVIADIDNDGQAEIIVSGAGPGVHPEGGPGASTGKLRIYKTNLASAPWAPARKVWNQYAYNAVNVNEDLTIPKYSLDLAMIFPGEDGILGTDDDVQPYNNFLQQQTTLNKNGEYLFLAPSGEAGDIIYCYHPDTDSMSIKTSVENVGSAAFHNPFQITVYRNQIDKDNLKFTYKYKQQILPGNTAIIEFGIPNFKADGMPFDNMVISFNDAGEAKRNQEVCTEDNKRNFVFANVLASDDQLLTFKGVENRIDVLANDVFPSCTPEISVVTQPKHGNAVPSSDKLAYNPGKYIGADTIEYKIKCSGEEDNAYVYVRVIDVPLIQLIDSCSFAPYMEIDIQHIGASFQWEESTNGTNWTPITDKTGTSYPATIPKYYRVKITYNGVEIFTPVVKLTKEIETNVQNRKWYKMTSQ